MFSFFLYLVIFSLGYVKSGVSYACCKGPEIECCCDNSRGQGVIYRKKVGDYIRFAPQSDLFFKCKNFRGCSNWVGDVKKLMNFFFRS